MGSTVVGDWGHYWQVVEASGRPTDPPTTPRLSFHSQGGLKPTSSLLNDLREVTHRQNHRAVDARPQLPTYDPRVTLPVCGGPKKPTWCLRSDTGGHSAGALRPGHR